MKTQTADSYVVVSEYYGEEQSICQVSDTFDSREAAQERADEVASWGRCNEVEVRTLADCLRNGIN